MVRIHPHKPEENLISDEIDPSDGWPVLVKEEAVNA